MKCYYCQSELVEDSFGNLCPNEECESIDGTIKVNIFPSGSQFWYKNGQLHREDGPAVERSDGSKNWYLNGQLHREDGPAVESKDLHEWYQYGANGTLEHWIDDKKAECIYEEKVERYNSIKTI
jgi:hypothetical protein